MSKVSTAYRMLVGAGRARVTCSFYPHRMLVGIGRARVTCSFYPHRLLVGAGRARVTCTVVSIPIVQTNVVGMLVLKQEVFLCSFPFGTKSEVSPDAGTYTCLHLRKPYSIPYLQCV